ncbi:hypothetical protein Fot_13964 [Forsythia ovata]|uniref:Uncharacterized protein n=1 Tax=Forsythia ovata TaxID=205694 RepID=A0ABD1W5E4_9LAMI
MTGKSRAAAGSSQTGVRLMKMSFLLFGSKIRLLYDRLVTDISIKLGTDLRKEKFSSMHPNTKIGASSLVKARFKLVDGVWTKPKVEVGDGGAEGAAHFMPPSPADWGTFMTAFWTFQANVMDNLSELRAQNRELMARQDHLDGMIKICKARRMKTS